MRCSGCTHDRRRSRAKLQVGTNGWRAAMLQQRHQIPIQWLASRRIPQATSLARLWRFDCCVVKREYEEPTAGPAVWMLEAFGWGGFRVRTGLRQGITPRRSHPSGREEVRRKKKKKHSNTIHTATQQHSKHSNRANVRLVNYIADAIEVCLLPRIRKSGRWLPVTRHAASPDRIER